MSSRENDINFMGARFAVHETGGKKKKGCLANFSENIIADHKTKMCVFLLCCTKI